jgi:hypothetical protein
MMYARAAYYEHFVAMRATKGGVVAFPILFVA